MSESTQMTNNYRISGKILNLISIMFIKHDEILELCIHQTVYKLFLSMYKLKIQVKKKS